MKKVYLIAGLLVLVLLALLWMRGAGCRRQTEEPVAVPAGTVAEQAETTAEAEFDLEVHMSALQKLAPVHHERMRTAAAAKSALNAYEQAQTNATPETLAADAQWQELKAAVDETDAARQAVQAEIAGRIRDRMRHESAAKQAGVLNAPPVPPVPPDPPAPPAPTDPTAPTDQTDQTDPTDPTDLSDPPTI